MDNSSEQQNTGSTFESYLSPELQNIARSAIDYLLTKTETNLTVSQTLIHKPGARGRLYSPRTIILEEAAMGTQPHVLDIVLGELEKLQIVQLHKKKSVYDRLLWLRLQPRFILACDGLYVDEKLREEARKALQFEIDPVADAPPPLTKMLVWNGLGYRSRNSKATNSRRGLVKREEEQTDGSKPINDSTSRNSSRDPDESIFTDKSYMIGRVEPEQDSETQVAPRTERQQPRTRKELNIIVFRELVGLLSQGRKYHSSPLEVERSLSLRTGLPRELTESALYDLISRIGVIRYVPHEEGGVTCELTEIGKELLGRNR